MEGSTAVAVRGDAVPASPFGGSQDGFDTAQRVAKALASSTVVPEAYRGNLPNVLVAMEYANRLGASVLAVMQNLDVIHGRPALRSTFLIGTVNASGRFSPIRYRWQGEEGKDTWGCRAVAKDLATGEECVGPLITIALAKKEGWEGKSGSKWKTIPELMLMYRAGSWWSRVYCPELSLGLHTSDEAEDMSAGNGARIQGAAAALDAGDIPLAQVVEQDDGSAPSVGQIEQVQDLRTKARGADVITAEDESSISVAIANRDGTTVRTWIRELSKRLLGAQASLEV